MRRSSRIDYKVFNATGTKSFKSLKSELEEVHEEMEPKEAQQRFIATSKTLNEDIYDFIDENNLDDCTTATEIDEAVGTIERLRSTYRNIINQLQSYATDGDEHMDNYNQSMVRIKSYIKSAKDRKRDMQVSSHESTNIAKKRALEFTITDANATLKSIESKLIINIKSALDPEIVNANKKVGELTKAADRVSTQLKELIKESNGTTKESEVNALQKRYENIILLLRCHSNDLEKELSTRDIEKHSTFKGSLLNIKLSKFCGFNSKIDIYTFQSEFEKLHLRSTPECFLPDLLRNNYLEDPALSITKGETDVNEIWKRLKAAYGDTKILLSNKLSEFSNIDNIWKLKNQTKIAESLGKIISVMKDLIILCKKHSIEGKLFHGDGIQRVYRLIGDSRTTRWLQHTCDDELDGEELWTKLISFLERELKINQQKQLINHREADPEKSSRSPRAFVSNHYDQVSEFHSSQLKCFICDSTDHVCTSGPRGSKLIQYFVCKKFVDMTPADRFYELKKKNLCYQCLFPGALSSTGKHRDGQCQRDFVCPNEYHNSFGIKKHVLVCDQHKSNQENQELLIQFKERCIIKRINIPEFSKKISIYHSTHKINVEPSTNTINDSGIYQLQQITVNFKSYLIFFDTGCSDFVVRTKAVKELGALAELQYKGPIKLGGVGDVSTQSSEGIYSVQLPRFDGSHVTLTGVTLDTITSTFPTYPLDDVKKDIHEAYRREGGNPSDLPTLPSFVGGGVDFMIGIKYLRYHPKQIFQLPSGLTIYQSVFCSQDGSRGIIGGPHHLFTSIDKQYHGIGKSTFLSNQLNIFESGFQVNPDVPLLCFKRFSDEINQSDDITKVLLKRSTTFDIAESAGSEISYRCTKCRSCNDCKTNDSIVTTSIREEIEQELINKSITVKPNQQVTIATLPFTHEPHIRLQPNRHKAMKVYKQQVTKLSKHLNDKNDVIESERKLQTLGHVEFVKNLPDQMQNLLSTNQIQNFIPWRAVWKLSSISTPCRLVFDASQPTDSGYSLNSILAKGTNGMNKLVEILIRWYCRKVAFHTDVTKMYNTIKLREDQWCFQRYLWNNTLDINQPPEEKVIKTLIYGVKSSGNQSERGIRETSALSRDEYPEVNDIINHDVYVDDCISGEDSIDVAMERADQMELVLRKGGFGLKGFTFSGKDPPDALSKDGKSIGVGGIIWHPKSDKISIDVTQLNFAKKQRGKKSTMEIGVIPAKLTRRQCVSKVGELFDITGKLTPITAAFKLDLHDLVQRGLNWDDTIPDDLRPIWESNFEMLQEIKTIKYSRTVIPEDASNLRINTVDFGDASKSIAAVAIYARVLRKNGIYSNQLIFSRSKILPSSSTQPRAELAAAVLNAHTGEVVKRSLKSLYDGSIKLTDSTIVLHWINNDEIQLKQYVRNRIVDILRFTSPDDWYHVSTNEMLADIATRKGTKPSEIGSTSRWINGSSWMTLDKKEFPTKTVSQIILNSSDLQQMKNEAIYESNQSKAFLSSSSNSTLPSEVQQRYSFSKYLIDPNKFRFKFVVRVLGHVFKFVKILRHLASIKRTRSSDAAMKLTNDARLTDDEIKDAERYFWRKGTEEVKHFVNPKTYKRISTNVDGILTYTGRILPSDSINIISPMTRVMKDLHEAVFCVPILDKHSPLAYAILNEVHWYEKAVKHSGIETTLRYANKHAFIIEGREVAKRIKNTCNLCRYLEKQRIKVTMGKIPTCCMTIAPAFFNTQADLAGPFQSYSSHNKRKSIKIWLTIFCCTTTSTTSIKVMDDYSTTSFLMAFTRFACDNGYPKKMFVDRGSQIVKGFQDATINFQDLQQRLHIDVSIDFELCPVGGHNYNGKVERKIREVRSSINKSFAGQRLSVLQWETVSADVANSINDLPLSLNGIVSDYETMDLLTPNRLKLGRNNDRSPVGPITISRNFSKMLNSNIEIFNSWFDNWLINHVPKIMHQPKWFKQDRDIMIGDIVLFLKNDSVLSSTYQYGMVQELVPGKDSKIRQVKVTYKNSNEKSFRTTVRAVRQLIVIHGENEESLDTVLNEMYQHAK